jgi:3-deoxy-D-manno-octulosonic-acid transferase
LKRFLEINENSRMILVPHQPELKTVERLRAHFTKWGVSTFGQRDLLDGERVVIVDTVGYLAGLYHHAHLAYVGGSFHQGIHNVIEPAIFGIPVLYGPVHENSYEAVQLSQGNGGIIVKNQTDIYEQIVKFHDDENNRINQGQRAEKYATRNTGATLKLIRSWTPYLE